MRGRAWLGVLLVVISCHDRGILKSDPLRSAVDPRVRDKLDQQCHRVGTVLASAPPKFGRIMDGCDTTSGDTSIYFYRDSTGRVAVVGRTIRIGPETVGHAFEVDHEKLGRRVDSIRAELRSAHGPEIRCPGPAREWSYRWGNDSLSVLLDAGDDAGVTGWISMETHHALPGCATTLGPPSRD